MRKRLLVFCLVLASPAVGQNTSAVGDAAALAKSKMQVLSPQTADLIRFDNMGSTASSGRLDLSIPVINFQDPDFDFPISISYNSAGFKPSEPDNYVGRNWALNCGGIVYREVKGIPDELAALSTDGANDTRGFMYTCRMGLMTDLRAKSVYEDGDLSQIIQTPYQGYAPVLRGNDRYEFSSDIYHFNFGRFSGKFTINFDGSVNIIAYQGGQFKVDLSQFPESSSTGNFQATIQIRADDGYSYYFGGNISTMEYTALTWTDVYDKFADARNQNTITTFHLSKIVAPNGRELHIQYKGYLPAQYLQNPVELISDMNYNYLIDNDCNFLFSLSVRPYRYESLDNVTAYGIPYVIDVKELPRLHFGDVYSMNKIALIESVRTDDKLLHFFYSSRKATPLNDVSKDTRFGQACGAQLDSVVLYDCANKRVEAARFEYTYRSSRMFLSSLNNSKTGTYAFDYLNNTSLPPMNTTNIDHWGYWRGDAGPQSLIPQISAQPTMPMTENDYTYTSKDREPSGLSCDASLLSRIVYPTGGCSEFEYEPHDYSYRLKYGSTWILTSDMLHDNLIAGGARLKKIRHKKNCSWQSPEKAVREIVYRYTYGPDSKQSSGMLLYTPRYAHLSRTSPVAGMIQYFIVKNDSGFNPKEYASDHICYSMVLKYEGGTHLERPDSTDYRLIYPAYSDNATVECDIAVGNLGEFFVNGNELEQKYGEWTIWGYGRGGDGRVYILGSDGRTKYYSHVFDGDRADTLRFKPTELLSPGKYRLVLRKTGNGGAGMRWTYPHTGSVETTGMITQTRYSTYLSNPDAYHSRTSIRNNLFDPGSALPLPILDEAYLRNCFLEPGDRTHERGKVLAQTYMDADKKVLREELYTYDRVGTNTYSIYATTPPAVSGATLGQFTQVNEVFFYHYLPVEKIVREYDGNKVYEEKQTFAYDSSGYLTEMREKNSDDRWLVTQYRRIADETTGSYPFLKAGNFVAPVTKKTACVVFENSDAAPGRSVDPGPISMITDEYVYDTILAPDNRLLNVMKSHIKKRNEIPGDRVDFRRFDAYANPIYTVENQSIHTVYLWGYLGKHIVAKIENATYEEVAAALGCAPEAISTQTEPDMTALNALRGKLLHAFVNTYTYLPLTGMISATDQAGHTTFYSYDRQGRLKDTGILGEQGDLQILQSNKYHYVNE